MQAVRLGDGRLAMAFNNSSGPADTQKPQTGPRFPLSVALSSDNEIRWTSVRDLETGDAAEPPDAHFPKRTGRAEYSYPSIVQLPNGKILVAYTYRREAIKAALFSEKWAEARGTTAKFDPQHPARPAK